jgi:hypothetical protein
MRIPDSAPVLAARCGAMRDASAKLREQARAICEASALLRRLTQWNPRLADPVVSPPGDPRRRGEAVVHCVLCGERVPARDLSMAIGRPTHTGCYEQHLRRHEASLRALFREPADLWCRSCLAGQVGLTLEHVNAISGRLLAQRAIRTAPGTCRHCRRARLVLAVRTVAPTD